MIDLQRLRSTSEAADELLLGECLSGADELPHWEGELSTSALSTATTVMALQQVRNAGRTAADFSLPAGTDIDALIRGGLQWLAAHQNEDGGWGDTVQSLSNISTTMLTHAVFHATGTGDEFRSRVDAAKRYIDDAGGVPAVVARYGRDKTFSVPILTHCALAGLVDWSKVTSLPFELACLPAKFYSTVRLPVVSYALPALIAIGQVKHHHHPSWNPAVRLLRNRAIKPTLAVLDRIQPSNGGFLEAAPLTSFVTMSLAGKGLVDHPVVGRAVSFLCASVRPDGSWPIDTNLATWTTTLSINALKHRLPDELRPGLTEWLLDQQYREVHPYTNADPGGWAWTNLPGGVPDADDTPGAVLALLELHKEEPEEVAEPTTRSMEWLLDLQNRDGGFPTFCRGWGTLPFDRSSPDITAHCLRALLTWQAHAFPLMNVFAGAMQRSNGTSVDGPGSDEPGSDRPGSDEPGSDGAGFLPGVLQAVGDASDDRFLKRIHRALTHGLVFLEKAQRPNGSWVPLWFGNQFAENDENPVHGTARVLMFYRLMRELDPDFDLNNPEALRAAEWLAGVQGEDGGWGGDAGVEPSVEETALAAEVLLDYEPFRKNAFDGIRWLMHRVEAGSVSVPTPIGFYFARLWYFEKLYPLIFAVSALRRAVEVAEESPS